MSKGKMPPQLLKYFKKKQGKVEEKENDKSEDKRKEAISKAKKQKEKG